MNSQIAKNRDLKKTWMGMPSRSTILVILVLVFLVVVIEVTLSRFSIASLSEAKKETQEIISGDTEKKASELSLVMNDMKNAGTVAASFLSQKDDDIFDRYYLDIVADNNFNTYAVALVNTEGKGICSLNEDDIDISGSDYFSASTKTYFSFTNDDLLDSKTALTCVIPIFKDDEPFAYLIQYIDIKTLALSSNKSEKRVLKDLRRLLEKGFFPQGHLDREGKTFILTDEVFNHYLELETDKSDNDIIDTTARSEDEQEFPTLSAEESAELSRMIREGNEYISRFRSLNNEIPGIEISAKLDRLEGLLKEIFHNIRQHPEQMSRIHELMDYYLPTAVKLVAAYKEYDSVSEPGKEILSAKNTLDTINAALGKLLNKLFKDSVLDVTTDAQVLQTILAQKGLAEPGMEDGILKGDMK